MDAIVTYFPVGNGDTSLIRLTDKTSILIDCNIRESSRDEDDDSQYDVHAHLLTEVERDESDRPFVDALILSHPDQDHCRGFRSTFHLGDPSNYKKKKGEPEKIIIAELWFSQRIFSNYEESLSEDAEAFRKEALRRIKLYREKDSRCNEPGNRIRIIGYGESEETKELDGITTAPGNAINLINDSIKSDFSFFVHAPFKRDVDGEDRNNTSIVLQACFTVDRKERAALAMFGGDACWDIWARVLELSEDETLEWDIFLAPHHCSWSFFNAVPYEENKKPQQASLDLLSKHRAGAVVVASSKPIEDDDDNPPHYPAKMEYVKVIGSNFYCCGDNPSVEKTEPIVFRMTKNGPQMIDSQISSKVRSASVVQVTLQTPRIYG
jgi:hypothetical protein